MRPARVLIVGSAWQRGTLAATRSLALGGGHAVVIASATRGHAARSRHCGRWHPVPPPDSSDHVAAVADVVAREGIDIVFAGDDEHLLTLSEHRHLLGRAQFPYPGHETVLRALDKISLYALAVQAGVAIAEVSREVPPATADQWIGKQRIYTPGAPHVHALGSASTAGRGELVFQRVIHGDLLAVVTLMGPDGHLLYAGAQLADALYPEPFGVSARARIVPLDHGLEDAIARLLGLLGWWGLAELQFMTSEESPPALIDFNGRFFGSLQLTAAAGIDLPSAWVAAASGQAVQLGTPEPGVSYQWLEGDLRRAAASSHPRAREFWTALRHAPRSAHSLWSPQDPVPVGRHALDLAVRAMRKAKPS